MKALRNRNQSGCEFSRFVTRFVAVLEKPHTLILKNNLVLAPAFFVSSVSAFLATPEVVGAYSPRPHLEQRRNIYFFLIQT